MLRRIAALFLVLIAFVATAKGTSTYELRLPKVMMRGVQQAIVIERNADSTENPTASKVIQLNGKPLTIVFNTIPPHLTTISRKKNA